MVLKVIAAMLGRTLRRGSGIFKILFVVDDFIRLFTMTLLVPLFFNWLGFSPLLVSLGAILGIVIDIHDFLQQAGVASINLKTGRRK